MINILSKAVDCIGIPYLVLFIYTQTRETTRRKLTSLLVIGLFILWRALFSISSSRYCLTIIPIAFFFILTYIKDRPGKKGNMLFYIVALSLVLYNIIEESSSFRNLYVYDIKNNIQFLTKRKKSDATVVYTKEFNRIKQDDITGEYYEYIDSNIPLTDFYNRNYLWDKNVLFIVDEKKDARTIEAGDGIRIVSRYLTNRKKNRFISLYQHESFLPKPENILNILPADAILKAYDPDFDFYVYESEDDLYYVINEKIPKEVKVICNLYPHDANDLPDAYIDHGYENNSFYVNSKKAQLFYSNDIYNVYCISINREYKIKHIKVGLSNMDRFYTIQVNNRE